VNGSGDAQPRADRSQRGEQDEAADVADEIAQVRRLRSTRDPLNSTSYAQGDDSFREKNHCAVYYNFRHIFVPYVADWLACWTQTQKGLGSNRSRDAVG